MNKTQYKAYLQTTHWRKMKRRKMAQADWRCEECGVEVGNGVPLDVHHLTYERLGLELLSDLRVLCRGCHDAVHNLWTV